MNPKPSPGRIVHYVLPAESARAGERRAAMITSDWGGPNQNLQVFLDQANDIPGENHFHPFQRVWSATYDADEHAPGTWHWPEREPFKGECSATSVASTVMQVETDPLQTLGGEITLADTPTGLTNMQPGEGFTGLQEFLEEGQAATQSSESQGVQESPALSEAKAADAAA